MHRHSDEYVADMLIEGEFILDFDDYVSSRDVFDYCF